MPSWSFSTDAFHHSHEAHFSTAGSRRGLVLLLLRRASRLKPLIKGEEGDQLPGAKW